MAEPEVNAPAESRTMPPWLRALLVVFLLYLFLVGVKMLEGGIKGLGSDYTDAVFASVSNPIAGLLAGNESTTQQRRIDGRQFVLAKRQLERVGGTVAARRHQQHEGPTGLLPVDPGGTRDGLGRRA
mgnify:CR=1 FL=1